MNPYFTTHLGQLYLGECSQVMALLEPASIHAVVTDPPYGLSFMGQRWDYDVPSVEVWREALRLLKPGGHLSSFGGTRTYHRLVVNIEDAGFAIRDQVQWLYGSGFPKSLDVGKAIDHAAGAERKIIAHVGSDGVRRKPRSPVDHGKSATGQTITTPATPEARRWDGWGTALKPAHEPICLARKPLADTVAFNVLAHGCGGLNIDICRLDSEPWIRAGLRDDIRGGGFGAGRKRRIDLGGISKSNPLGRWPTNVILDPEAAAALDAQSGPLTSGNLSPSHQRHVPRLGCGGAYNDNAGTGYPREWPGDSGGASRFFYCAKASPSERGPGNNHPTVKPLALMRWLVRLVCPPGGVVLDPFLGSGTTAMACEDLGIRWVGIEREEKYCAIAKQRLQARAPLFAGVSA